MKYLVHIERVVVKTEYIDLVVDSDESFHADDLACVIGDTFGGDLDWNEGAQVSAEIEEEHCSCDEDVDNDGLADVRVSTEKGEKRVRKLRDC